MRTKPNRLGLRVPANRVNPRALLWWALRGFLWAAGARLVLEVLERELPQYSADYWEPLTTATYVVGAVLVFVVPPIRYQIQRWETTGESVYVRDGLFTVALRVTPISRIQTVTARRGPLEQLLRLTTVVVTSASSIAPMYMVGLDRDLANEVEQSLTERAQLIRDDAA